jgi:hypothetical protein
VAELELLADDDVPSRLHEGARGRESHHPRSDDDDVCVEGGHAGEPSELREQVEQLARLSCREMPASCSSIRSAVRARRARASAGPARCVSSSSVRSGGVELGEELGRRCSGIVVCAENVMPSTG